MISAITPGAQLQPLAPSTVHLPPAVPQSDPQSSGGEDSVQLSNTAQAQIGAQHSGCSY